MQNQVSVSIKDMYSTQECKQTKCLEQTSRENRQHQKLLRNSTKDRTLKAT